MVLNIHMHKIIYTIISTKYYFTIMVGQLVKATTIAVELLCITNDPRHFPYQRGFPLINIS